MAHIDVRPLQAGDEAAWRDLWGGYQRFYEVDIPEATSGRTFARLLDPEATMGAFVGEVDGAVAGLVHYVLHDSTWTVGRSCYLQDLFVSPDARSAGLGGRLIERVADEARRRGCERLYWLTHEDNLVARRLYDAVARRSGFIQYRKSL